MQSPFTNVDAGPDPDYKPPGTVHGRVVKPNKYPECQGVYDNYYKCILVTDKDFGKFFGSCNSVRRALDACQKVHMELTRKRNLDEARAKKVFEEEWMAKREKEMAEQKAKEQAKEQGGWRLF